jgi:tRNA(Met) cytidine acetyltransferase
MPDTAKEIDKIIEMARALRRAALAACHRRVLMLSGSAAWCLECADAVLAAIPANETLWVSRQAAPQHATIDNSRATHLLGGELELLVYDAHSGFDADAFGALCGLLRGGGLLLLLTPSLESWPSLADPEAARFFDNTVCDSRFLRRFTRIASDSAGVTLVNETGTLPEHPQPPDTQITNPPPDGPCKTGDQQAAVDAVIRTAKGHRHRPMVLISDRGRGKSTALGIAAAQLFEQGLEYIVVTAPRMDAVAPVFEHAARLLPQADARRSKILLGDCRLEFIAPDELIAAPPACDLLLVDEAAAIPAPMLSDLLSHHARIVFATTVHGYEGTGRGFALRFNRILDEQTPDWHMLRMETPIRWAADDPLEAFVFDALLLNATITPDDAVADIDAADCCIEQVERDELMKNEALLSQLFGLLVLAHYRTRPNDLRQLLDSPALSLYIMRHNTNVVGVALLLKEGALDTELGNAVYLGRRRLHGHLIPQSLAAHGGLPEATALHYGRIMRIAVHPATQGRGLGIRLVQHILTHTTGVDIIGCSFGLTEMLYRFWHKGGFVPARLGLTREQSSASHALIMLRPISQSGTALCRQAQERLQRELPMLLADPLRGFDPTLAALLLHGNDNTDTGITDSDWRDLVAFAFAARGYEFCLGAITRLVTLGLADKTEPAQLTVTQRRLLIGKVMQKQSWSEVVENLALQGRHPAVKEMRAAIAILLQQHCPATTLARIKASLNL